jgi:hypothetical protein
LCVTTSKAFNFGDIIDDSSRYGYLSDGSEVGVDMAHDFDVSG